MFAVAETPDKASPKPLTSVLANVAPFAIKSAYFWALSIESPKPFTDAVTYVAALSRLIAPADAKLKTVGIALIDSSADKPACANIFNPSAASLAVYFVVAPMFKAVFCKFSKSLFPFLICSVVIPIVAATCDIALSNLVATPTEAAPTPTRGRVKPFVNPPPTVENALLKPFNFCSVVAPLA